MDATMPGAKISIRVYHVDGGDTSICAIICCIPIHDKQGAKLEMKQVVHSDTGCWCCEWQLDPLCHNSSLLHLQMDGTLMCFGQWPRCPCPVFEYLS